MSELDRSIDEGDVLAKAKQLFAEYRDKERNAVERLLLPAMRETYDELTDGFDTVSRLRDELDKAEGRFRAKAAELNAAIVLLESQRPKEAF